MIRTYTLLVFVAFSAMFSTPRVHAQFTNILNVPPDAAPTSIGSDTQLNLAAGGILGDSFAAGMSGDANNVEVHIAGGVVGTNFNAAPADGSGGDVIVNISDGTVGTGLLANPGGSIFVTGGEFVDVTAFGGLVRVSGGDFSSSLNAVNGGVLEVQAGGNYSLAGVGSLGAQDGTQSTAIIIGGTVGAVLVNPLLGGKALLTIAGGTINQVVALPGSEVNLSGTQFLLDAVDITESLTEDVPLLIPDRDMALSGILADGSEFSFDLSGAGGDFFSPSSLLTVTLVNANTDSADFDTDNDIDGDDFLAWQRGFGTMGGATKAQGDANDDGNVNAEDLAVWEKQYGDVISPLAATATVPEPTTAVLLSMSVTFLFMRRRARC